MFDTLPSQRWIDAGVASSVEALTLRFAVVLNGLFEQVEASEGSWFIVDQSGILVDCGASAEAAVPLLGSSVTRLAGGLAEAELDVAWQQLGTGESQVVWPWMGGRARATARSIELHPLRDTLSEDQPIIGAVAVFVEADARITSTSVAA